jgi:alpha-beta hydrolase superfamily lysophospholipase
MFKEITFKSSGINCHARLYTPKAANRNGAGIVLGHGLCGTIDTGLPGYAEAFANAGFHALVFDYRGFGLSDGTPRQFVSVPRQRQDWLRAIATLRGHADVDADSIGLWGISFSGGHVVHMAHKDPKIKAIVAQVPMIDPVLTLNVSEYERGIEKTEALQGQIVQWLKKRWFTNKPEMLLAVRRHDDDVALLATEEAKIYAKLGGPSWRNEVHPDSFIFGKISDNNASLLTDDLSVPVLLQMGKTDRLVSNEAIVNFARRCGPLARLSTYDARHFTLLQNNALQKQAIKEAISFYDEHLTV